MQPSKDRRQSPWWAFGLWHHSIPFPALETQSPVRHGPYAGAASTCVSLCKMCCPGTVIEGGKAPSPHDWSSGCRAEWREEGLEALGEAQKSWRVCLPGVLRAPPPWVGSLRPGTSTRGHLHCRLTLLRDKTPPHPLTPKTSSLQAEVSRDSITYAALSSDTSDEQRPTATCGASQHPPPSRILEKSTEYSTVRKP